MTDKTPQRGPRPAWLLPTPAGRDEPKRSPLREFTLRLMRGENLKREEAAALLDALLDSGATDAQIGAALVALAVKGETVEELAGFASAMRARAVRLRCAHGGYVDTAGPGSGPGQTLHPPPPPALLLAGAGAPPPHHRRPPGAS